MKPEMVNYLSSCELLNYRRITSLANRSEPVRKFKGSQKMTPEIGQIAKIALDSEISLQNHEKVANFIQKNGVATRDEIVEATSLGDSVVKKGIKALKSEGLIIKKNEKKGKKALYQWVGGVSAVEDELESATAKLVSASLLAETYDSLINDPFALFSIIFDGHGWEVIANIKEGLTDTELHQSVGSDVSLDSIRRILVICDSHGLITLKRIRVPAGAETIKLFQPLYRINYVNREYLEYVMIIRGLAAAIQYRISDKKTPGYSPIYAKIFDKNIQSYILLKDKISKNPNAPELKLLEKLLRNYDYAADIDRVYHDEDWRQKLTQCRNLKLDDDDHLLVSDSLLNK